MTVDNSFFIKQLRKKQSFIVAYCAYTGMHLVVCDPETYNDQIWLFDTEEQLQEFARDYTERKILLRGVRFENKNFLEFFSMLFTIGVNEVVFSGSADMPVKLELTSLVNPPDYSKMKPQARPVTNPNLQLTGLYFMQEASRPVPMEEKEELRDLEEEFASNLVRARYLMPVVLSNGPGSVSDKMKRKQYQIPLVKNKTGDVMQPLFTDLTEFRKFSKGSKQMLSLNFPFAALEKILVNDAKGFMLNPAGFHILLTREVINGLPKRFPQQTDTSSAKNP